MQTLLLSAARRLAAGRRVAFSLPFSKQHAAIGSERSRKLWCASPVSFLHQTVQCNFAEVDSDYLLKVPRASWGGQTQPAP